MTTLKQYWVRCDGGTCNRSTKAIEAQTASHADEAARQMGFVKRGRKHWCQSCALAIGLITDALVKGEM